MIFTNPIIQRCLEATSSTRRSEYPLYASDQLNHLWFFAKELNVSMQNDSLFFFPAIFQIQMLLS